MINACHMNKHQQLIQNIFLSVKEGNLLNKTPKKLTYSLKDNICVKGPNETTTCNSSMLSNYKSPFNSTIYEILSHQPNFTYVGKTKLDEFAMGSMGTNNQAHPVLNPIYPDRVPGGSSSGAAASVAARIVDFALGTDTGGSVRLPAAWCGTIGFKPTYGKISRYGVIDMAQSLDTVGVISNDISIIDQVFEKLDKYDPLDLTSLPSELRSKRSKQVEPHEKQWKIGIPQEICIDICDPAIREKFKTILNRLFSLPNVSLYPVSIPSMKISLPIYYTLCPSEVASNFARYDGIRYGLREEEQDDDLEDVTLFASTRSKHLGKEVKRRIMLGNYTLLSGSYQNNYLKAQRLRMRLINEFDSIFRVPNILMNGSKSSSTTTKPHGMDFLLVPTSLTPPPKLADVKEASKTKQQEVNPITTYMNDLYTVPMSLAGLPTITVPMTPKSPLGLQMIGQFGDDYNVLDFTKYLLSESKVLI